MKTKSTILLLIAFLLSAYNIWSQEKWSQDPRMTNLWPSGEYITLPQYGDNYVHPNTTTRIINTPIGTFVLAPNFRVHPTTTTTQSEVIIVRHPLNQLIMFGSANTVWPPGGFLGISEGVHVTTNGGLNWFGWDTLQSVPITGHGGDPGPTIDKNGVFIMTHLGYPVGGMYANYSTNNGANWSSSYTIASGSQDKNFAGTDDAPSSAYYGRSYCVWSRFNFSGIPIAVSYTTNGGVSWSPAANINTSVSGHYSQGCDIRVGPNGEVYVCWSAPISGSPFTEDFAGFARSTNGGVTWTVTDNAFDQNGIRGFFSTKNNIRVNGFTRIDVDRSGGPRNGWIYIVTAERNIAPAGSDPDIVLHRSTDGGATWSAGIRVNQDPLNNGKYQWFGAIRVDEYGAVNVVYYDDRTVASNQAEVYVSRSLDGGNTWTDVEVSDHLFTPAPIAGLAGGYQGDYIGITSGNNKVWPIWMDNSSGIYQSWTTSIDLGPSIAHTPLPNTENLTGPYAVNCVVTPAGSPIDPSKTRVLWSRNNPAITDSVLMTNTSGNNWTANIPGNGSPATYRYYIKTADLLNRIATAPPGAPANLYLFLATPDTSRPVITHTPLPNIPRNQWPATVNAVVTDNIGLDSVWVRWYRNNQGTGIRHFRLNNVGGSNFSAVFNSDTSQVVIGDIIYYRIFAQDNSSNHNKDSTVQYNFSILGVSIVTICRNGLNKPILDFTNTYDTITVNISNAANIVDVNVKIDTVTHTWDGDLQFYISHTSVSNHQLIMNRGGSGDNFIGTILNDSAALPISSGSPPFTGSFRPEQPLTAFNNLATNGTWILRIYDNAGADSGFLRAWCITIQYQTLVGNIETVTIPNSYTLSQNYPNPFNPSTSIKFSLPKLSNVKLVVYDVLGREVITLVKGLKQAGSYEALFDGRSFASGVYFYKIEVSDPASGSSPHFVDVKKMILVK